MSSGQAVVLFDGECAFCEGSARFIARHDRRGHFRFGASQSARGASLLAEFGLSREMTQSIVLIEDGQVFLRSTAALRIAGRLPWPWSLARILLHVPLPVRDGAYRVVSALRRRIAGPAIACDIPPREIRGRLI